MCLYDFRLYIVKKLVLHTTKPERLIGIPSRNGEHLLRMSHSSKRKNIEKKNAECAKPMGTI